MTRARIGLQQSRSKRVIGSVLLLMFSVLVAGILAEVVLRVLGHRGEPRSPLSNIYPVDDPIIDWRYVPRSRVEVGKLVKIYNSAGFRDVEHSFDNPLGRRRVVVVGDSVAEGYGVEWPSVFAARVASQLGDGYEVINLAMQGLNTPQEIHLLAQSGVIYKPDLVVLNFVLNDADFYTNFRAAARFTAEKDATLGILNLRIDPRVKRLLKSSAFIYFVKESTENLWGRFFAKEQSDYFTRLWASEANRRRVLEAFDRLAALRTRHGFEVVVIIWPLITEYKGYRFEPVHAWVSDQASQRGFATLDLLRHFAGTPYRQLQVTSEDNVHPNSRGHSIGADVFLAWYQSQLGARPRPMAARSASSGRREQEP